MTIIVFGVLLAVVITVILELVKPYAKKAFEEKGEYNIEVPKLDVFIWLFNSIPQFREMVIASLNKIDPILLCRNIKDTFDPELNIAIDNLIYSCGLGSELLSALKNDLRALDNADVKLSVKIEYERYSKYRNNIAKRVELLKLLVS